MVGTEARGEPLLQRTPVRREPWGGELPVEALLEAGSVLRVDELGHGLPLLGQHVEHLRTDEKQERGGEQRRPSTWARAKFQKDWLRLWLRRRVGTQCSGGGFARGGPKRMFAAARTPECYRERGFKS